MNLAVIYLFCLYIFCVKLNLSALCTFCLGLCFCVFNICVCLPSQGQFGVQEEELLRSLTCTLSVTRGEAIRRLHNQQQAEGKEKSTGPGSASLTTITLAIRKEGLGQY